MRPPLPFRSVATVARTRQGEAERRRLQEAPGRGGGVEEPPDTET